MELTVSAFITVKMIDGSYFTTNFEETLSSILAILTVIMLLYAPVYLIFAAFKFRNNVGDPIIRLKYKKIFEGFDYYNIYSSLFYSIFLLRRLLYVIVIVFSQEYPWLQIFVHLILTGFTISYLFGNLTFLDNKVTNIERFNEINVLLGSYCLILLTDFNPDREHQYNVGYILLGITTFNMIVNISNVTIVSIINLVRSVK
mmetsp:Transcript_31778/g.43032  ORF Transcript_31778/g.43032 Transcript_31778/m.43032 type:complete len:201 (-) Transcript_31778:643-1245(-)